MTDSIYSWHQVPDLTPSDIPEGKILEVDLQVKKVSLLRRADSLYAFAATCPHAGAPLCAGWLDPTGHVVCPLHKYRFDPANGRNTSGEGYKLRTYPLEVKNNLIFIGLLEPV